MTFSEKLHVSEVERREPQDKEEWITRIAKILLCDRKKHEGVNPIEGPATESKK